MAAFVYLMCTLSAMVCAAMLIRGFRQSRSPMLLWSGLCFCFLTLENLVLCYDRIVLGPAIDLTAQRAPLALFAVACLLYGVIWKDV